MTTVNANCSDSQKSTYIASNTTTVTLPGTSKLTLGKAIRRSFTVQPGRYCRLRPCCRLNRKSGALWISLFANALDFSRCGRPVPRVTKGNVALFDRSGLGMVDISTSHAWMKKTWSRNRCGVLQNAATVGTTCGLAALHLCPQSFFLTSTHPMHRNDRVVQRKH